MKTQICLSLLFLLLFSSCATFMNGDFYQIDVKSVPAKIKLQVGDSTYTTPTKITVERSKKDLQITASNDSITKRYEALSYLSTSFLCGNCGLIYFFPLGYLVDLTNPARFTYGSELKLNLYDTIHTLNYNKRIGNLPFFKYNRTEKGMFFVKYSVPYGNHFFVRKRSSSFETFGFWGLTTELGYFCSKHQYFSIGAGAVIDFPIPVPASLGYDGEYEGATGLYIDICHGFQLKRFSFSYGLNWTRNKYFHGYQPSYLDSTIHTPIDTTEFSVVERKFGFSLETKMKMNDFMQVGIKYLPSLYIIDTKRYQYTHFLFFELIMNINVYPKKPQIK